MLRARVPRFFSIIAFLAAFPALANGSSCDIGLTSAATLLLPYFEVDLTDRLGETTLFAVTNMTEVQRYGRVTLWTDFGYPVLSFDISFRPYEIRRFNLYDVLARGVIDPRDGEPLCGRKTLAPDEATRVQMAFTEGRVLPFGEKPGCNSVGNVHQHAIGYATVDVVGSCASGTTPADARHFRDDLRYDNVFIGDYQQIAADENYAQGSPMVHIRAFPEGGTPELRRANPTQYANGFSRTFYGRFQDPAHPTLDARQPLPSTFAFRWINGGKGGFQTSVKIWRENAAGIAPCGALAQNGMRRVLDVVVFDEDGNGAGTFVPEYCPFLCIGPLYPVLPATSRVWLPDGEIFPHDIFLTAVSGWAYLNLDHDDQDPAGIATQAWVVTSMRAEGRYSVDMDAVALRNGCAQDVGISAFSHPGTPGVLPGPNAVP